VVPNFETVAIKTVKIRTVVGNACQNFLLGWWFGLTLIVILKAQSPGL